MRIVSGSHKGRRIKAPTKLPVRPTTDMAKEGLFNILNNRYYFDEIKVLDLFSGTGNISYEFASRGTENITAVDAHMGCICFIESVSKDFDFLISAIKSDVFTFLSKCATQYDIIFADPPYDLDDEKFIQLVNTVFENNLLTEAGLLILEHAPQSDFSLHPNFTEKRKYGSSVFDFFAHQKV